MFRVFGIEPADASNAGPMSIDFNCPAGMPELHVHTPTTCMGDDLSTCMAGGLNAYSCQPSRGDLEKLIRRGDQFAVLQCDQRAFRFYYPSEYVTPPALATQLEQGQRAGTLEPRDEAQELNGGVRSGTTRTHRASGHVVTALRCAPPSPRPRRSCLCTIQHAQQASAGRSRDRAGVLRLSPLVHARVATQRMPSLRGIQRRAAIARPRPPRREAKPPATPRRRPAEYWPLG